MFSWYGIGVALVALAAGAWFGLTAPVVLGALVAGTGLVARGWAAICLWGVTARRSLDGARAFPGDTLSISLALDNGKPLPLSWIRARQCLPEGLHPLPDAAGCRERYRHRDDYRAGRLSPPRRRSAPIGARRSRAASSASDAAIIHSRR